MAISKQSKETDFFMNRSSWKEKDQTGDYTGSWDGITFTVAEVREYEIG
jgi:hypothetical protein